MLKSGLPVDWDDAVRRVRSSTKVTEGFAFIGEIVVININYHYFISRRCY